MCPVYSKLESSSQQWSPSQLWLYWNKWLKQSESIYRYFLLGQSKCLRNCFIFYLINGHTLHISVKFKSLSFTCLYVDMRFHWHTEWQYCNSTLYLLGDDYMMPVRLSYRYNFNLVPIYRGLVFVYMTLVRILIPVRIIPVWVYPSSCTGTT